MMLNDERLEVVRVNMLGGTMEVTTESLKANLQSYVNMREQRDQYKAENEKLKEKVERLNEIIRDEEEWKLLESEEKWE